MNLWINGCLFFAGLGGLLMTIAVCCMAFSEWINKTPDVNQRDGRVLVIFKDGKEEPIYIEKDGVISCVYMPKKETRA